MSLRERVIFLLVTLNFDSFIYQVQLSIVTIISLAKNDSNKRETETSEIKSQVLSSSRTDLYRIFYRKFTKGNCMVSKYVTEESLLTFDHQNRTKIQNKFSFAIFARRWRLVSSYHLSLRGQNLRLNFSLTRSVRRSQTINRPRKERSSKL